MKEHPIIFSTPMVKAILEGRKTQTRRIVKTLHEHKYYIDKSPYGQPGDLLWIRERFETETDGKVKFYAGNIEVENNKSYERLTKWKPSIHMPKAAARIWLKITSVKVERLQDISDEDAIAEGVEFYNDRGIIVYRSYKAHPPYYWSIATAHKSFETLWQSINGNESWDANPWVWVISFEVISKTGKP